MSITSQLLSVQEVVTHFFIELILYKMGHYFLDTQYNASHVYLLLMPTDTLLQNYDITLFEFIKKL